MVEKSRNYFPRCLTLMILTREKGRGHSDLSRDLKELCFDQDTMAKTVLSDYGQFHSFLLVPSCGSTIKTDD